MVRRYPLQPHRNFPFPLPRCEHSPGALPLPNSPWTDWVYKGYFPSLKQRWSYLKKRRRRGWKYTPIPERFYGKAPKRSTTSLTQLHCQCPHLLSFPIKKRVLRWRKNQAMTQPPSDCKISIRQGFSWNVSWVKRLKSWPKDTMIIRSC